MDSRVIAGILPASDVPPDDQSLPNVFSPQPLNFYSDTISVDAINDILSTLQPINVISVATSTTGKVLNKTVKKNEVMVVTDPIGFYVNEVDPNRLLTGRSGYKVPELAAILKSLGVVYIKSGKKKEDLIKLIVDWSIANVHDIETRQTSERSKHK